MRIVYFWPDGTWCFMNEYTVAGYGWKSYANESMQVDSNVSDAEIDSIVRSKVSEYS